MYFWFRSFPAPRILWNASRSEGKRKFENHHKSPMEQSSFFRYAISGDADIFLHTTVTRRTCVVMYLNNNCEDIYYINYICMHDYYHHVSMYIFFTHRFCKASFRYLSTPSLPRSSCRHSCKLPRRASSTTWGRKSSLLGAVTAVTL